MRYNSITQFEPLLPQNRLDELLELARQIIHMTSQLRSALHPYTASRLSELLREMNSYYSNKIEGHSTHPINIARGLRKDFSSAPKIAQLQRIALAHINAEIEIESWINNNANFSALTADGIHRIHESLYSRLSAEDRTIEKGHIIKAGMWRNHDVQVGRHIPPAANSLPAFLRRYEEAYNINVPLEQRLIIIASAHHRLTWIHPFLDGNGRVTRLASHAALYRDFTSGLWSICRGLARTHREYYMRLENADEPRRGDLDGRGNLTEAGLWDFCYYFLSTCLDQVNFITNILNLNAMRKKIAALVLFRSQFDNQIRPEAELPLHYLFTSGELTRAEFKQMTGLGSRVAQQLLSRLLKTGLIESSTPLGPVRFGLPLDALQFYFPDLYPEASTLCNL